MEKTDVNGVELQYEVTGAGEAVLLVATGPIADSFFPLLCEPALAERYSLIRYRQRRFKDGKGGPTPVSFAEHASDAAALLEQLGIRRAHVVGHSTGADIALQLAVQRPDIVNTLALLEPPLASAPGAGAFFEKAGPAVASYSAGDLDGAMSTFLSVACSLDWESCRAVIDRHVPGAVAEAMRNVDNFFESYLPAITLWQFGANEAAAISQPVLSMLGGETDPWFVDGDAVLGSWFPQLERSRIEGVAHLLHMQRPAPVAEALAAFFARHPVDGV